MKTEIEKHIDHALLEIISNGCKLPSALIKNYFDTAILMGKLEQQKRDVEIMFKPDVIGSMITEPSDPRIGKWYKCIESKMNHWTKHKWYQVIEIKDDELFTIDNDGDKNSLNYYPNMKEFDLTNPQDTDPTQNILGSGINDTPYTC
jgi:hypothetical protein